jgi:vacuolar-type H+-ATPase subunit I/STV1
VREFLDSVLSGATKTVPMSQRPGIPAQCDGNTAGAEEEVTDSHEDASDFLEEIRREEEERAQRLKKELEEEAKRAKDEAKAAEAAKGKDKKKGKSKKGKKKGSSGKSDEL